jgi:hypothetical protein
MPEPIFVVQTSWPKIRFALYRRQDGFFQFFREYLQPEGWESGEPSGIYDSDLTAREDMARSVEDFEDRET